MATAAPTSAPPNFYENLPAGGDAAAGGPPPPKPGEDKDADEELMKSAAAIYRVVKKMGKLKKGLEPFIAKIKADVKDLAVTGLKMDPKDLDSGDDDASAGSAPPPPPPPAGGAGAPPTSTDESHAA